MWRVIFYFQLSSVIANDETIAAITEFRMKRQSTTNVQRRKYQNQLFFLRFLIQIYRFILKSSLDKFNCISFRTFKWIDWAFYFDLFQRKFIEIFIWIFSGLWKFRRLFCGHFCSKYVAQKFLTFAFVFSCFWFHLKQIFKQNCNLFVRSEANR